ncbi:dynein heavy chain 10, axonemal-like [Aplysia californica]|uniref:Dynein heavy chain 10, axonemal-like n=1 Tax=Aplysia californica TaxID=6500 RepID=A0ABM1ADT0_APLCA|nr:dynein heavy chain 10, axonemal-like [Aplysia californica]
MILMENQLSVLKHMLHTPSARLNWFSLNVKDCMGVCFAKLQSFETMVNTLRHNSSDIGQILTDIQDLHLFRRRTPVVPGHVNGCKEVFDYAFSQRDQDIEVAAKKVSKITILLTKMESVLGNRESESGAFSFSGHWEKKIFHALTQMVIGNLKWFNFQLRSDKPLFSIESLLASPDVVLNPQTNDIYKTVVSAARDVVARTKKFVRWLNGTYTEAPPQKVKFLDQPFVYSFFTDIAPNPEVIELIQTVVTIDLSSSTSWSLGTLEAVKAWTVSSGTGIGGFPELEHKAKVRVTIKVKVTKEEGLKVNGMVDGVEFLLER